MSNDSVRSLVDNLLANKEADAMQDFNAAMAAKLTDAFDSRRQEIASTLGQSTEEEEVYVEEENKPAANTTVQPQLPPPRKGGMSGVLDTVVDKVFNPNRY